MTSLHSRPIHHGRTGRPRAALAGVVALALPLLACATAPAATEAVAPGARGLPLTSSESLTLVGARAEPTSHAGRSGIQLQPLDQVGPDDVMLAIVQGPEFRDGEIDVEVSGAPHPGAPPDMRGFIGVSFHVSPDGSRSEDVYLRPDNGRADDQLRRNHSVQYQAIPGWGWKRLRDETPGVYESYADLQPGVWTRMRVKVSGTRAELYVNGAEQPTLIVRDLKHGAIGGGIALWAHRTTVAYFRNLVVTPR
jgi:hypothetical protein